MEVFGEDLLEDVVFEPVGHYWSVLLGGLDVSWAVTGNGIGVGWLL